MSLFSGWQKYPWKPLLCWRVNHKDVTANHIDDAFIQANFLVRWTKEGSGKKEEELEQKVTLVILTDYSQ